MKQHRARKRLEEQQRADREKSKFAKLALLGVEPAPAPTGPTDATTSIGFTTTTDQSAAYKVKVIVKPGDVNPWAIYHGFSASDLVEASYGLAPPAFTGLMDALGVAPPPSAQAHHGVDGATILGALGAALPDLKAVVTCPACGPPMFDEVPCGCQGCTGTVQRCVRGLRAPVERIVQHLNDVCGEISVDPETGAAGSSTWHFGCAPPSALRRGHHGWPREQIADWLDTLDLDLQFTTQPERTVA